MGLYTRRFIFHFLNHTDENAVIADEIVDESESSTQNVNKTNTNDSIVDFDSNDDSIIPETQDVLSQDSIVSLDHTQSDIDAESGLVQSQSNSSVASISGHEVTQIKAVDEKKNSNQNRIEIDLRSQASTTLGKRYHFIYSLRI